MARQDIQLGRVAFPIQNKFGKIQSGRDNIIVYISTVTFFIVTMLGTCIGVIDDSFLEL